MPQTLAGLGLLFCYSVSNLSGSGHHRFIGNLREFDFDLHRQVIGSETLNHLSPGDAKRLWNENEIQTS
mgnify:CR=1 FL=1